MDVHAYLARIDYHASTEPTIDTLRGLHRAHLFAVPFENLDIEAGRKIVLDESKLLSKVVDQRRGGFCYELNGAFAALLRTLGFSVTLLSARVSREKGGEGPEFDHLALRVDIGGDPEDPWLSDVGFGDSFLEPLRLQTRIEQHDPAGKFRLRRIAERLQLDRLNAAGVWRRQYSFTLEPRQLSDFAAMCHYHQTSPESHFTQNRICSRATPDGCLTLSGMKWIVTRNGHRNEEVLNSEEERTRILREQFGIRL
jgi:N-hydroxyarylamine O-acetyltransferase